MPEYIGIVQQPSVKFYESSTSLFDTFKSFLGELNTCIELEQAKSSDNILQSLSDVYSNLNSTDFAPDYDGVSSPFGEQFQLYFIEKYSSLLTNVRDFIGEGLGDGNVYFIPFSDDIGNLTNQTSVVDNSTSPFFDTFDTSSLFPNALPASLYNKVSETQLDNNIKLSVYTDALMKVNLNDIQETTDINIAKTAHGDNLVGDNLYIDRLSLLKDPVNAKLKTILGNMADFINFFKGVNWQDKDGDRASLDIGYGAQIEEIGTTLDMLKNKVEIG